MTRSGLRTGLVLVAAGMVLGASSARAEDYASLMQKGIKYTRGHNLPRALEAFSAAVEADPTQLDGYFNAGNVAQHLKKCREVLLYFRGFLHLSPGTADDKAARAGVAACEKEETGLLTVKVEPKGAEVSLNGAIVGKGPLTEVKFVPGTYRVGLSCKCPDFQDASVETTVKAGETAEVVVELPRTLTYGLLQVITEPKDGVEVYLDDKPVGTTPVAPLRLETRKYLLRLEKPGYDRWIRAVTVQRDRTLPVQAILEKTEATVPAEPGAPAGK